MVRKRLGPLAAAFVGFGAFWGAWAVSTADVERSLHVSHRGFGLLLAAALGGAAMANAPTGALAERWGTRRALTAALALWGALLATGAAVRPAPAFALALAGTFTAGGAVDVVMNVAATAALADEPGRLVRFHAFFNAGAAGGAVVAGVVLRSGASWRWLWLGTAGLAFVLAAICSRARLPAGDAGEHHGLGQALRQVRAEGLVLVAIAFAVGAMVEGGIETWGVLYLRDRLAVGVLVGAGAAVAGYGIATLARVTIGPAAGSLGAARGVAAGAVLTTAGLVLMAATHTPFLAAAGLAAAAAGISLCWPLLLAHANRGSTRPGLVVGGVTSVGYMGFVVGPALVGAVAGAAGLRAGLLLLAAASVFVAVAPATSASRSSPSSDPSLSSRGSG